MGGGGPGAAIGALDRGDARQFSREMRDRRQAAESLRRDLAREGREVGDLERAIQRMRELESESALANPEELARLQAAALDALKEFEFNLRRELDIEGKGRPVLGGSNDVPAGFRRLVEEYYRSLSQKPQR